MKKKIARTIIDSLEEDDSPSEWRERRNSELEDVETDSAEEYALMKWTENVTRSESISTQETIEDLIEQQNEFTNELVNELEKRGVENEYIAAQNNRNHETVEEETEHLKRGQEGLTDDHSELSDEHDEILTETKRGFIKAGIGGGFIAGGIFGAAALAGKDQGPVKEEGYLNIQTAKIVEEEAGDHFNYLMNDNGWKYATDGEGTDLAGIKVYQDGNDFGYKLAHIETDVAADDDWKDVDSIDELLENYNDAIRISPKSSLDNEDLGEYMLDVSKSENPEELDFDDYLED